ncbi:MAG: hypothetical protein A2107_04175 [Verrucomicrobia bacterium GWF2_62_7]|nr:MAG: hypothetical protein A2107_04175 [Verrucomicrobia bacterium GWF2_62_7]
MDKREQFRTDGYQERIDKPWGYEVIFTPSSLARTGKLIFVRGGCKLSLQYHDKKEETFCLVQGEAMLWIENDKGVIERKSMTHHSGYTIAVGQKHRIEAVTDALIFEVSCPEIGTTVRVDDEYQREHETDNIRQQPNRGWQQD